MTEIEKRADEVRAALLRGLLDTVASTQAPSPEERLDLQERAASVLNALDPRVGGGAYLGSYASLQGEVLSTEAPAK